MTPAAAPTGNPRPAPLPLAGSLGDGGQLGRGAFLSGFPGAVQRERSETLLRRTGTHAALPYPSIPAALMALARCPFLQALAIALAVFAGFEPFRWQPVPPVTVLAVRPCKAVHDRLGPLTPADEFCERHFFTPTEPRS